MIAGAHCDNELEYRLTGNDPSPSSDNDLGQPDEHYDPAFAFDNDLQFDNETDNDLNQIDDDSQSSVPDRATELYNAFGDLVGGVFNTHSLRRSTRPSFRSAIQTSTSSTILATRKFPSTTVTHCVRLSDSAGSRP